MSSLATPIPEYPFKGPNEDESYKQFPRELEDDPLVFFHGTADKNRQPIIDSGFKIQGELPSVSFARSSALALSYACKARDGESPTGCILAVRFGSIEKPGIIQEDFGIHVCAFDSQPDVIGYCIVPKDYEFR